MRNPMPVPGSGSMASDKLRDEQLMRLVAGGDESALAELFDRYAPATMGLSMRILGDRSLAEDVVQETFWRIWTKASLFDAGRGTFSSWMFGIARNLSVDTIRKRNARPLPLESAAIHYNPDPEVNVASSAFAAIKQAQVQAALAELPPEQRQVIELSYFDGLTRMEIAKVTGAALGTVHTRARLGLQKLRAALAAQGYEEG